MVACASGPEHWQVRLPPLLSDVLAPTSHLSGQQHELLDWLSEVTFPMEARFSDVRFAERAYTSVIKRTIDYGVRPSLSARTSVWLTSLPASSRQLAVGMAPSISKEPRSSRT